MFRPNHGSATRNPQRIPNQLSTLLLHRPFSIAGVLIDFGLAEPAEKWQGRSKALAKHRDKRTERGARGKQNQTRSQPRTKTPLSAARKIAGHRTKATPSTSGTGRGGPRPPPAGSGSANASGSANGGATTIIREKDDRLKLLRKVERGGTTGFRAPEILWHCRDQVCAFEEAAGAGGFIVACCCRSVPIRRTLTP